LQPFIAAQTDGQTLPVIAEFACFQTQQTGAAQLDTPAFAKAGLRQQPHGYGEAQSGVTAVAEIDAQQDQQIGMEDTTG
jgi:hypothetical protein